MKTNRFDLIFPLILAIFWAGLVIVSILAIVDIFRPILEVIK